MSQPPRAHQVQELKLSKMVGGIQSNWLHQLDRESHHALITVIWSLFIYLCSSWLNVHYCSIFSPQFSLLILFLFCLGYSWNSGWSPETFLQFVILSITSYAFLVLIWNRTCVSLESKGRKLIAGVKNLITFIFFFHLVLPSSLEFERKGERKHHYCPKCVPWMLCATGRKGR